MLNALIIDDDPFAIDLLRQHLHRVSPAVRVIAEAGAMREAEAALRRTDYDVVFLDVHLIGGIGFDLVPFVHADAGIIFVTGRDDHAVRAFEVNAVDYIVKPVTSTRLAQALRRLGHPVSAQPDGVRKYRISDRIFLRGAAAGGRFAAVSSIVAIFSSENYTEVLLLDGARWLIRKTMEAWEATLPEDAFVRVRRTAIVNLRYIEHVTRAENDTMLLTLHGVRHAVPVGRHYWPDVRRCLRGRG